MDKEKINKLMTSSIAEDITLGLELLKKEDLGLFCALIEVNIPLQNYNRNKVEYGDVINTFETTLSSHNIRVGTKVRYKGMENSPTMVINHIEAIKSTKTALPGIQINIRAKWFNKSRQEFLIVSDPINYFEILE